MITQRILINYIEHDDPLYQVGLRYKAITPNDSKDLVVFYTYQEAMAWVDAMGIQEAQGTLF